MAVLVLGEVSKKMIEADGFGTKINFGLAKIRDFLKLVSFNNNFTRSTDNAYHKRIPQQHGAVFVDRGRQAPTADGEREASPLTTAGAAGVEVTMYGM